MSGVTRRGRWYAVAALAALALTACGQTTLPSAKQVDRPVPSGTVTFAQAPGQTPNYILPLESSAYYTGANSGFFSYMMYPPLYWMGSGATPYVNYKLSLAYPPEYTNGGLTVLLRLRHFDWSTGSPVTSRDIQFWMNLIIANKGNWAAYVPGEFPANVTSMSIVSPTELSMTFDHVYNHNWLLDNELSQIFPIPQASWDKTSASGAIGNYDDTTSGAVSVYNFLNRQSQDESTYPTNPLWKVVDGAWRISQFSPSTGYTVLVPNPHYSGEPKPTIAKLVELPFTSDTAEFDALKSGEIDYGYLPFTDLAQRHSITALGYRFDPWKEWSVTYMPINFTNPTTGPLLKQLYIRQAMQHLINQPQYVKDIFKGYAATTYGPVPVDVRSPDLDKQQTHNPYPFSEASAKGLLKSHGWHLVPNGTSTCSRPGSASGDCGSGITAGQSLSFKITYATGNPAFDAEMEAIQSSFSLAGVNLVLTQAPASTVFADSVPCDTATHVGCSWSLMSWGEAWGYNLDFYPTGDEIFSTGAESNYGGYSSPVMNKIIAATYTAQGLGPLYKYENYTAKQLPVLWLPNLDFGLSEISTKLMGVSQGPVLEIVPQAWRLRK